MFSEVDLFTFFEAIRESFYAVSKEFSFNFRKRKHCLSGDRTSASITTGQDPGRTRTCTVPPWDRERWIYESAAAATPHTLPTISSQGAYVSATEDVSPWQWHTPSVPRASGPYWGWLCFACLPPVGAGTLVRLSRCAGWWPALKTVALRLSPAPLGSIVAALVELSTDCRIGRGLPVESILSTPQSHRQQTDGRHRNARVMVPHQYKCQPLVWKWEQSLRRNGSQRFPQLERWFSTGYLQEFLRFPPRNCQDSHTFHRSGRVFHRTTPVLHRTHPQLFFFPLGCGNM